MALTAAVASVVIVAKMVYDYIEDAQLAIAAVRAKIKAKDIKPDDTNGTSVYVITPKGDDSVVYVGITSRNPQQRWYEHKARFSHEKHDFYVVATGLSRKDARALEQILISAYTLDALDNAINSVSYKNWGQFLSEYKRMMQLLSSYYDLE